MGSDSLDLGSGRRFDIKFQTKEHKYAIPDTVFHVPGGCLPVDLNQLVNATLSESADAPDRNVDFDFLVEGVLMRLPLEEHLEELSTIKQSFVYAEKELQVEYFTKQRAPEPHQSLAHDDWVSGVAACDNYVLSGCYDGTVQIWELSGAHILSVPAHLGCPVKSVAWINTDALVASGIQGVGRKDRLFVSASQDETLKIWKWSPHKDRDVQCLYICKGHCRTVNCVGVNVDIIASGSIDCHLKIWSFSDEKDNAGTTKGVKSDKKKQKKDDGDAVAVSSTSPIVKTPLITLSGHKEAITSVTWITDDSSSMTAPEVATGSMDNTIRIWDIEVNEVKQTVVGSKAFLSLSYSHSRSAILSSSADRHIRLWDLRSKNEHTVTSVFSSHHAWVSDVCWSPKNDNFFISGSYDNVVKHWDVRSPNAPLYDLIGHKDKVLDVDWSNPGYVISGSADNFVKIFKMMD